MLQSPSEHPTAFRGDTNDIPVNSAAIPLHPTGPEATNPFKAVWLGLRSFNMDIVGQDLKRGARNDPQSVQTKHNCKQARGRPEAPFAVPRHSWLQYYNPLGSPSRGHAAGAPAPP
eukprot:3938446-Rhodomonas_salina.1